MLLHILACYPYLTGKFSFHLNLYLVVWQLLCPAAIHFYSSEGAGKWEVSNIGFKATP